MRITNQIISRQALSDVQRSLKGMERSRREVALGRRIQTPSDDPVANASAMHALSNIRATGQYQRNISTAVSRLGVEETVLDQASDLLMRARELGAGEVGGSSNPDTRASTRAEVEELRRFATDLANTRFGDSYLFGGLRSDTLPFPGGVPDPAAPPVGERRVEIGPGRRAVTTHSGQQVFVDTGVLDSLEELSDALAANDSDAIHGATVSVKRSFDELQEVLGELGSRMQQLEVVQQGHREVDVNLKEFVSDLRDVELEESVSRLVNQELAYQAALMANARMLNLNLTEYLR